MVVRGADIEVLNHHIKAAQYATWIACILLRVLHTGGVKVWDGATTGAVCIDCDVGKCAGGGDERDARPARHGEGVGHCPVGSNCLYNVTRDCIEEYIVFM